MFPCQDSLLTLKTTLTGDHSFSKLLFVFPCQWLITATTPAWKKTTPTGDHSIFKLLFVCISVSMTHYCHYSGMRKYQNTWDHSFKLLFVCISMSMTRYCCKGKDQPNNRLLLQTALQLCFCACVTAATQAREMTTLTRDHSWNCSLLCVSVSVLLLLPRQGKRPP